MKYIILFIALTFTGLTHAESASVVQISAKYCKEGVHKQPKGQFALYAFCDDALGTNVSVFLSDLGAPLRGAYRLTKRFWQSDEWGADRWSIQRSLWCADQHPMASGGILDHKPAQAIRGAAAGRSPRIEPVRWPARFVPDLAVADTQVAGETPGVFSPIP